MEAIYFDATFFKASSCIKGLFIFNVLEERLVGSNMLEQVGMGWSGSKHVGANIADLKQFCKGVATNWSRLKQIGPDCRKIDQVEAI